MRPVWHIVSSAGLGACVYQSTGNWSLAMASAASGVFMDIDHAFEHVVRSDRPFCLKTFWGKHNTFSWPRVIFIFHSYELILLLVILSWFLNLPVLWAIVLGMFVHILLDEIGNRLPSSVGVWRRGFIFFSIVSFMGLSTIS